LELTTQIRVGCDERYGTDNLYRGVWTMYLDFCGERERKRERKECWEERDMKEEK
jgi:hypothetical protein